MKRTGLIAVVGVAALVAVVDFTTHSRPRELSTSAPSAQPTTTDRLVEPPHASELERLAGPGALELRVAIRTSCAPLARFQLALIDEIDESTVARAHTLESATFRELARRSYRVALHASGWNDVAQRVQFGEGESLREITLTPEPAASVHGFVRDARSHAPIVAFQLSLENRAAHAALEISHEYGALSIASDAGEFCAAGFQELAGDVRARVSAEGYEPASSAWISLLDGAFPSGLVIELEPRERAFVSIEGRVHALGESGGLADARVQLVDAGADVDAASEIDGFVQLGDDSDATATQRITTADGAFHLESRVPRRAFVRVRHADFREVRSRTLELARGGATEHLDFALEPGASIRGRVAVAPTIAAHYQPTRIVVRGAGPERWIALDAEGRYRVAGLDAGSYGLSLQAKEFDDAGGWKLSLPMTEVLTLAERESRECDFELGFGLSGATLRGRIVEPPNETWRERRIALVDDARGPLRTQALADSNFELTEIPRGEFLLAVCAHTDDGSRWEVGARRVELDGVAAQELEFDLRTPAVAFRLAARTAERGERVLIGSDSSDPSVRGLVEQGLRVSLGGDGRAVVFGLGAAHYTARAERSRESARFAIEAGSSAPLEIRLP